MMKNWRNCLALFALGLALGCSHRGAFAQPQTFVGNPRTVNSAVGGRTLGLDAICGDCVLEKFATCPGRLEGPTFDKAGNLWVIGIDTRAIYRVAPTGACTEVTHTPGPNGLRFHKDGRLFGTDRIAGLFWIDPQTLKVTFVAGQFNNGNFHGLNDLVFDKDGGLYFTDSWGSGEFVKRGQLFYMNPAGFITRLADSLSYPNGVGLSPDEKILYVSEWGSNRVAAFPVSAPGVINLEGGYIFASMNSGRGPDGLTLDAQGNVYVAHHSAGEVLVFSPRGFLYGAIRMPDDSMVPNNVQFHEGYLYITEADQHAVWRVKTKVPGILHFQDR